MFVFHIVSFQFVLLRCELEILGGKHFLNYPQHGSESISHRIKVTNQKDNFFVQSWAWLCKKSRLSFSLFRVRSLSTHWWSVQPFSRDRERECFSYPQNHESSKCMVGLFSILAFVSLVILHNDRHAQRAKKQTTT